MIRQHLVVVPGFGQKKATIKGNLQFRRFVNIAIIVKKVLCMRHEAGTISQY